MLSGEALSILHHRFWGQDKCRAAFMRVAGLAGGDLAPGMLEDIVIEMLALPAVRGRWRVARRMGSWWDEA